MHRQTLHTHALLLTDVSSILAAATVLWQAEEQPAFDPHDLALQHEQLTRDYPDGRVLSSVAGTCVLTDPWTGVRSLGPAHVAVLEQADLSLLVRLFGGPTGAEGLVLTGQTLDWHTGWFASVGVPNRIPSCYVPGSLLRDAWLQALDRLSSRTGLPRMYAMTSDERTARVARVRAQYGIASGMTSVTALPASEQEWLGRLNDLRLPAREAQAAGSDGWD